MSIEYAAALRCDLCSGLVTITWGDRTSKALARKAAREKYGWRVDKLNRDICNAHPTLKPRKSDKEK